MRSERAKRMKTAVFYNFFLQNLIQYNEIKISSEFEKIRITGFPTAEGQKSQKWCIFAFFDPLRLDTPLSEFFQTRWKFLFRYTESDFVRKNYKTLLSSSFLHARNASTKILHRLNM